MVITSHISGELFSLTHNHSSPIYVTEEVFNFDLLKSSFLLALLPIRLLEGLEGDIVLLLEMKLKGAHIRVGRIPALSCLIS